MDFVIRLRHFVIIFGVFVVVVVSVVLVSISCSFFYSLEIPHSKICLHFGDNA